MSNQNTVDSNLIKLLILKGLAFTWFPIPTLILFYRSHGLDIQQAVLLKTILSLSVLVLEVPSGYLADKIGRKFCLVAGSAVWLLGWLFYCGGSSFAAFAIAEILSGVAVSLISGADTALAYESLLETKRASFYPSFEGRLVAVAGITEAVCGIIGAAVAEINLVYPFYLQTVCLALYCGLSFTLVEPKHRQALAIKEQSNLGAIAKRVFFHSYLRWLICLSSILSAASFLMVWLSQDYLRLAGLSVSAMGWGWALFHVLMSLASVNAPRLQRALGMKQTLLVLVTTMAVAYLLLGSVTGFWGMAFICLVYIVRGMKSPLLLNLINSQIPSSIRATVLSLNSFAFSLGFALYAPLVGAIASRYSLATALLFSGSFFLVAGCFSWWRLTRLEFLE